MMYSHYGEEQADPNAPAFVYVATIPDEERDKAMAEAFRKAQAAGVQLGPLVGVGGSGTNAGPVSYEDPGQVRFVFTVTANFALEKETEKPKATKEK